MKLSIIVPIYNVAPYLRKCVDSLLAQDISDYEIILVDDGSTDDSGAIADELVHASSLSPLASRFQLRVIHQSNAGLSAARNTGIMAATGDYVVFVDSDDYWQENVLGELMAQIEKEQLDVLRFDYQNVKQTEAGEYLVFQPNKYPHQVDTCREVVNGEAYLDERMGYACYAVQFIVRRELAVQELFTPNIHFEDVDWTPRMLLSAKRVNSTSLVVYNYLVRQGSITQVQGDKSKMRKNLDDSILVMHTLTTLRLKYPRCQWLRRMISSSAVGVLTRVARVFYSERREYIYRLREMKVFPLAIANQGKTYTRRAWIINLLGPNVYCFVMRLCR
jgi:glycosyltransferase involved in cell wall biosynthesis